MSDQMCFVGFLACGCCVAAMVDRPEYQQTTKQDLLEWARNGYRIERKTVEWVRENLHACPHQTAKRDRDSAQSAVDAALALRESQRVEQVGLPL